MAHIISALCFVSRMRLRDRGGSNAIPLGRRTCTALYKFFNSAAFHGPVGNLSRMLPIFVLIATFVDRQETGRYDVFSGRGG